MTDLTLTRSSELMVVHVEGNTEEGIEFVDAYVPPDGNYVVVDAGRIVVPEATETAVFQAAHESGLSVEGVKQP